MRNIFGKIKFSAMMPSQRILAMRGRHPRRSGIRDTEAVITSV